MEKFAMPCVILSGGMSKRMGILKQNLKVLDSTLANFQAKHFLQYFNAVYFSAKTPIANDYGIPTLLDYNTDSTHAPIFGLCTLLESLQCDTFVCSIDAPFLDFDTIKTLFNAYNTHRVSTFAKNSKLHPLLGIYCLESLEILKEQIAKKDYKLTHVLEKIAVYFAEIKESKTQNLNTYTEYKNAKFR